MPAAKPITEQETGKNPLENAYDFEDIRPYYDAEAHAVLKRMSQDPLFMKLVGHLWPDMTHQEALAKADKVNDVMGFQLEFMHSAIRTIVSRSSTGLSCNGFQNLDKSKAYLFVANHRDILLDSAILQILLVEHGFVTSEITFGDNLMEPGFITDFGRINRMFTVQREGTSRELYDRSKKLSAYIRHTVSEKNVSVWIAQRNGRTKDGLDQTQTGLLKMLNISGEGNFQKKFSELNIVPLTISYEYEPCDALKVKELYLSSLNSVYRKAPGEDMNSILTGILQPKGRIHMEVGKPISSELESLNQYSNENEKIRQLSLLIDTHIYKGYKLWPGNYIAADLQEGTQRFASHYSDTEKEGFERYMRKRLEGQEGEPEALRAVFLKMYATPCLSAFAMTAKENQ
jgi:1-acyl-sn-glycerol-3-phosphate acyltransferase